MVRTKTTFVGEEEPSRSPSPPPTKKSKKNPKSKPKKHSRLKVQDKGLPEPPPKANGILIQEPRTTHSMTKATTLSPEDKGKSKAPPTPPGSDSDSNTSSWTNRDRQEARYNARITKVMANMLEEALALEVPTRPRQSTPRTNFWAFL